MKSLLAFGLALLFLGTLAWGGRQRHSSEPWREAGAVIWDVLPVSGKTQADANLLRFPDGTTLLIDAGESTPLVPQLVRLGVRHIDKILVSHPHIDHYGAIRSLLQSSISIGEIEIKMPPPSVCEYEKGWGASAEDVRSLIDQARAHEIPVREPQAGEAIVDAPPIRLETLYAYDGVHTPVGATDGNDMSAIQLLTVGKTRALFTGDLNRPLGEYLAAHHDPRLQAELLKVPHHGTDGVAPDRFFAWVDPHAAFVPSPAALWASERSHRVRDWFTKAGVPTYVTGIVGRIHIVLMPDSYRVYLPDY